MSMKPALRRLRTAFRPGVKILKAPPGIEVDWDVPVKVRDGMVLRVDVFRPKDGAPVPVIMSAHPYGKDEIPARTRSGRGVDLQYRLFPQPHPIEFSEWTSWEPPDPAFWVPRAYAVVNVDLRGGGTSEGVGELFSYQEAMDLILTALIVAISVQSNSDQLLNGRLSINAARRRLYFASGGSSIHVCCSVLARQV